LEVENLTGERGFLGRCQRAKSCLNKEQAGEVGRKKETRNSWKEKSAEQGGKKKRQCLNKIKKIVTPQPVMGQSIGSCGYSGGETKWLVGHPTLHIKGGK